MHASTTLYRNTIQLELGPHQLGNIPIRQSHDSAFSYRYALGALDSDGELSRPLGKRMAALPLHPMYAKASPFCLGCILILRWPHVCLSQIRNRAPDW